MTILAPHHRKALLLGRQAGIRSSSGAFDQVEAQLRAQRAKVRALKLEIAILRRDLEAARLTPCKRDTADAFARASSPSTRVH